MSDAGDATGFAGLTSGVAGIAATAPEREAASVERELAGVQRDAAGEREQIPTLARTVEALLFLSSDPLSVAELADASQAGEGAVQAALAVLAGQYAPGRRGIHLRELGGGWTFASDPDCEDAARRLLSRPRVSTLSPAQAETLAIVSYLQPISRPEITRIRGVSADSATATLLDRDLIEEAGHSQFGAVLYRTTTQFLKLFGLRSLERAAGHRPLGPDPRGAGRPTRAPAARRRGPHRRRRGRIGASGARTGAAGARTGTRGLSRSAGAGGELPARGRDVPAAGQAHGRGHAAGLQRGAEGRDRLPAGAVERRTVAGVGCVVRDQVDLEDRRRSTLARQRLRQRQRLLIAVVDPGEHHVLDEHPPALALVELAAGRSASFSG